MIELNGTVLIQIVNFIVMVLFLNHFLFKPILKVVEKRDSDMKSLRDDTSNFTVSFEKKGEEYREKIAETKKSTTSILHSARQQAAAEHDRVVGIARERYTKAFEEANSQIEEQVRKAKVGLQEETKELSRLMAVRILGREIR